MLNLLSTNQSQRELKFLLSCFSISQKHLHMETEQCKRSFKLKFNKFDFLEVIISNNIDILGIAETNLTIPFPPVNSYWMPFILPFVTIEIDTGANP